MALSEKQLAAGRAKTEISKGHVTPDGHRNSSLSKVILINGQCRDRLTARVSRPSRTTNSFVVEFEPDSPAELAIVRRIGVANRLQMRTANLTHEMGDRPGRDLDIMSRHEYGFGRLYSHALEAVARNREPRARATRSHLLQQNKGSSKIVDPILSRIDPPKGTG
jgi:hypothetical protein